MTQISTEELASIAKKIRRNIVDSTSEAGSGHPSSSLSAVEIATTLYFGGIMKYDPKNPSWPDRDRFILSKGHAAPLLYAVLAQAGYFPESELMGLRKFGSMLEGHPNMRRVPGVEASTGSLGQGLSMGIGHALAARLDNRDCRVYVLQGDGETEEGQVWEAVMFAGNHAIDNITLIVDRNRYQQTGKVADIADLDPLADKFRAFKWEVTEIDGHALDEVVKAFEWAQGVKGRPQAILASTKKGKGVTFLEQEGNYHGKAVPKDRLAEVHQELEESS